MKLHVLFSQIARAVSHPAGVRGLKLAEGLGTDENLLVAPRRGAWIETSSVRYFAVPFAVAPRRGAWIETLDWAPVLNPTSGRTPQGCVD